MSDLYQKLETCLASVQKRTDFKPEVALILGSGLEITQMRSRSKPPLTIQRLKVFQHPQLQATKADLYLDM